MIPSVEVELSGNTYQNLVELVYQHSRIRLGSDKYSLLTNRLHKRLATLGLTSYDEYFHFLQSSNGATEIEQLVDLVSTNYTHFYREPSDFIFLTESILPTQIPRLMEQNAKLRIWSAAASSGEEAYTLALVLSEYFSAHPPWEWRLTATDISHRMVERGRMGLYGMSQVEPVPMELLRRYFQRGVGPAEGTCRVKDLLRRRIHFERINLFQKAYPIPILQHVIFCRNVMIYFDAPSREAVVQQLTRYLSPGGYLFVGLSGSLFGIRHGLISIRQGIYRKPLS